MEKLRRIIHAILILAALAAPNLSAYSRPGVTTEFDLEYQWFYGTENRLVEPYKYKSGIDLMRSYFKRPPLARLLLEGRTVAGFGAVAEAVVRDQWTGDYFRTDNFPVVGTEGDPLRIENFFFTKAAVFYENPGFSFLFGREKPDYNGTLWTGLLPGTRLPYLDSVRARGKIGRLTIDWMVANIPSIQSWETQSGTNPDFDVDPNEGVIPAGALYYGWESSPFSTNPASTIILEGMNRLSWDLGPVSIGITDHAMMARRQNRFYITDFIPVLSRHQAAVAQTNNSMAADISWTPVQGLILAAQAGFDDINADIIGVSDTGSPTIDAYVAGIEYQTITGFGSFGLDLEAGYTHWLWGNYDGSEIWPNDVNPFLRFQYRYLTDSGALLLPLTSPYGPGAVWLDASARASIRRWNLDAALCFGYLSKNSEANLIDTPVINNTTTAAATRTRFMTLALSLTWKQKVFAGDSWEITVRPKLLYLDGDIWHEIRLSTALRIR